MNAKVIKSRQQVTLDGDNHRFVLTPLKEDGDTVPSCFRAIHKTNNVSLRELAQFAGLENQSQAFKVAYSSGYCARTFPDLKNFLVIDKNGNCAYLYDKDHRPASGVLAHVGPVIINKESALQPVVAKIPTKVTSRITINDPIRRQLQMAILAEGGYILGINDVNLTRPGMTYETSGTAEALNQLLRQIHFVGTINGESSLTITVDDNANEVSSVVSATVKVSVSEAVAVSVPDIILPADPTVKLEMLSAFEPVTVEDTDGKLMEFRVTPFGCTVVGFTNYLQPMGYGEVRKIYGRPETINAEIANLKVIAHQTNAQLGIELVCGSTLVRKYLEFAVVSGEVQPTLKTVTPPASAPKAEPTPPPVGSVMLAAERTLTGTIGEPELLELAFTGDRTTSLDVVITPTNCSLAGFVPEIGTLTESHTFSGTVDQLNNVFASLEVTPTAADGTITVAFPGIDGAATTETVNITATAVS